MRRGLCFCFFVVLGMLWWSGDRGFDLSMGDVGALDLCPSPKGLGVLSRLSASVCDRSCSCLPC